jgi:hypothetical protein
MDWEEFFQIKDNNIYIKNTDWRIRLTTYSKDVVTGTATAVTNKATTKESTTLLTAADVDKLYSDIINNQIGTDMINIENTKTNETLFVDKIKSFQGKETEYFHLDTLKRFKFLSENPDSVIYTSSKSKLLSANQFRDKNDLIKWSKTEEGKSFIQSLPKATSPDESLWNFTTDNKGKPQLILTQEAWNVVTKFDDINFSSLSTDMSKFFNQFDKYTPTSADESSATKYIKNLFGIVSESSTLDIANNNEGVSLKSIEDRIITSRDVNGNLTRTIKVENTSTSQSDFKVLYNGKETGIVINTKAGSINRDAKGYTGFSKADYTKKLKEQIIKHNPNVSTKEIDDILRTNKDFNKDWIKNIIKGGEQVEAIAFFRLEDGQFRLHLMVPGYWDGGFENLIGENTVIKDNVKASQLLGTETRIPTTVSKNVSCQFYKVPQNKQGVSVVEPFSENSLKAIRELAS